MRDRVYPVPVKPPSKISTWEGWPDDVRDILWRWNKRVWVRMSFVRSPHVFKCADCGAFCEPHPNGAVVLHDEWLCDDCAIVRARAFLPVFAHLGDAARAGFDHHGCTCQVIDREAKTCSYDPAKRETCRYHVAAAMFPEDHAIPWNCPTYYDGCNCTRPKNSALSRGTE